MPSGKVDYHVYMASREWRLKRKEVIAEHHNICQRCGSGPIQNVHHLTYERLGNEETEDLVGLCRACHEYVSGERESDPGIAVVRELIRTKGITPDFRGTSWDSGFLWWSTGPTNLGVSFYLHLTCSSQAETWMLQDNGQLIIMPLFDGLYAHCWWM